MRVVQGKENRITQGYKPLTHKGIDIGWKGGDNDYILAHTTGTVVKIVTGKKRNIATTGTASYGNYIKIKHSNGYFTLYAHLDEVYVKVGEIVQKGQRIGYMGESGRTFGKHLHFEVRNTSDVRIDPTSYLDNDLPLDMNITYQVYDNVKKKWLPNVKTNSNEYAGNIGNTISGLYIDKLRYRVHDKVKNRWLPYVTGRNDFGGNLGNPIDGLQIENATYRVHVKGKGWLSWISKVDNTSNGYAGIYGKAIDAIQIKIG